MANLSDSDVISEFEGLFDIIYKGNAEAKDLSLKLISMAATLDTLIDKDRPVKDTEIYDFANRALFELPVNRMWQQFGLHGHLLNAFLKWRDSNSIESDNKRTLDDLRKTYMLRAGIYDIFVVIAYYLYGDEWASEIGPIVRRSYGESFDEYIREIGYAKSSCRIDRGNSRNNSIQRE